MKYIYNCYKNIHNFRKFLYNIKILVTDFLNFMWPLLIAEIQRPTLTPVMCRCCAGVAQSHEAHEHAELQKIFAKINALM